MTLDKKMVYNVYAKDWQQKYYFLWNDHLKTWLWIWLDGFSSEISGREVMELLSFCEHFPDYRTLTISPAGTSAERELPTGKL